MGVGGTSVFAHLPFQLVHFTCRMLTCRKDQEFGSLSTQSDFNLTGHRELGFSVQRKEEEEREQFFATISYPSHLSHVISQPGEPKRWSSYQF